MSQSKIDRRTFLKVAGATLAGAALSQPFSAAAKPIVPPGEEEPKPPFIDFQPSRVLASSVAVYSSLDPNNRKYLRSVARDGILSVFGEFDGPGPAYNHTWYQTRDGFAYSGWLQKMEPYRTPIVYTDVGAWGMWVEVIAPYLYAYAEPDEQSKLDYKFYYGTTYHVTDTFTDANGNVWYDTYDEYASKDDNVKPTHHWIWANLVRKIDESVFTAINPHTPDKHIYIDLAAQTLTCKEGDTVVLTSRIASGAAFNVNGEVVDYSTPGGEYSAILKMPSRHMRGPESERNTGAWFDDPGVPWNTFFTYEGIAIHGTYWHNDFGVPRSHGCVNVPIAVAKFVYFWTNPVAPYQGDFVQGDVKTVKATPITVTGGKEAPPA